MTDKINSQQENLWIEDKDKEHAFEQDETLKHTFGNTAVNFRIMHPIYRIMDPLSKGKPETGIMFWREPDGTRVSINIEGNIDTAKELVDNTIKHFDKEQDMSILDINNYFKSEILKLHQEAENKDPQSYKDQLTNEYSNDIFSLLTNSTKEKIENPQDLTVQLAKKSGYVQGVCECVAAIGDDRTLGKKLLSEMNVTKDLAKKFASPETYKTLEQGIFAPQHEQTHSIKR
jgi:hypothetical protein